MQYRIRINFKDDEKRIISAYCFHNGESSEVVAEYKADESLADFTERLRKELDEAFANRVVTEKVSVPNPTIKEENTEDKAKDAQVKYYESRGYIKQVFTGKAGSGKSTKGGAYAQENNYKICKVIEYPEKEVWFYKAKDGE